MRKTPRWNLKRDTLLFSKGKDALQDGYLSRNQKKKGRDSRRNPSALHYISINTNKFYDQKRTLMIEEFILKRACTT